MAISLKSISKGAQIRAPRLILLGTEKVGKSTFAAGANKPLFIPIVGEEGIDALDVARFPAAKTFVELIEMLESLMKEDHDYKTVVIDSTSALEPLIWTHVCGENGVGNIEDVGGGFGKGYIKALDSWRLLTSWLDALREQKDMASILIGHVKVKGFNDPTQDSYDMYQFDINDKASAMLYRWSDSTLFANTKSIVKHEDKGFNQTESRAIDAANGSRFLYTGKRPAHPGGGRGVFGRLPYELPLNWPAYQAAIVAQIEAEKNPPAAE
jgi:hypothetical protein